MTQQGDGGEDQAAVAAVKKGDKQAAVTSAARDGGEDALAALLASAQGLADTVAEKSAGGAAEVSALFEGFFDDSQDQDDLVDQVLSSKDETLRQLYDENETLKAEMEEYRQTVEQLAERLGATNETLKSERATQQQLRDENASLLQRLQEATNVIRTMAAQDNIAVNGGAGGAGARGAMGAAGAEGEGADEAINATGTRNEVLQKLLTDVQEVTDRQNAGAPRETERLEEAAELCEQGHRLFSESRVEESVGSYSKALDILEPLSEAMDPEVAARVVELSVYCLEESARCYHQLGQSNQCIVTCTNVLALYPQHLEALIFRGMARAQAGPLRRARLDLELAEQVATEEASQRGVSVGEIAPLLEAALVDLRAREDDESNTKQVATEGQERAK